MLHQRHDVADGGTYCLHTHAFFKDYDFFRIGKPSRIAFNDRDVREDDKFLVPSESRFCFSVPWFKVYDKNQIDAYAACFRTVIENHEQLLEKDISDGRGGRWYGSENR